MIQNRRAIPPDATIEAFRKLYAAHPDQRLWVYKNQHDQFQYQALHNDIPPPPYWRASPNHPWNKDFKLHGWLRLDTIEHKAAKRKKKRDWIGKVAKVLGALLVGSLTLFLAICGAATKEKK